MRFQKKVTVPRSLTTSSPPGPPGGWRRSSERSMLLQDAGPTTCLDRWPKKQSRLNASTPACRPRLLRQPKAHDGRTSGGGSRVPLALATVERQTAAPIAHRSSRPVVGRTLVRSTRQRSATTFSCGSLCPGSSARHPQKTPLRRGRYGLSMAHGDSARCCSAAKGPGSEPARHQPDWPRNANCAASHCPTAQLIRHRRFAKGDKILTVHNKANFQPEKDLYAARRRSSTTAALAAYPSTASANR
jgi:hypothetical protein